MKLSVRLHWVAAPLVVAAIGLAGCSGDKPGLASPSGPDDNNSAGSSSSPSISAPEKSGSHAGLAETDPCSLVAASELRIIGEYGEGASRIVGTGRVCEWKEARGEDGMSATLTATIRENAGIGTIRNLGHVQQGKTQTSGRDLARTWNEKTCVIAMSVGSSQRVEVSFSEVELAGQEACEMAGEVVEIIDPKLPLG